MEKQHITIDIISDVMCPWCYIGKKRLEKALMELDGKIEPKIRWFPYQLDASLPPEGKDRKQYFIDKFGSLENYERVYQPIRLAGQMENIPFRLEDITRSPNTLDAHRLIHWAGIEYGLTIQHKLVGVLMSFFFEKGKNIGDHTILIEAAKSVGMAHSGLKKKLWGNRDKDTIKKQVKSMHNMGINGVPFFIFNQTHTLQGAQKKETIINVIQSIIKNN